jgi:hypothetical protein
VLPAPLIKPPHVIACPCCGEPMKKIWKLLPAWRADPARASLSSPQPRATTHEKFLRISYGNPILSNQNCLSHQPGKSLGELYLSDRNNRYFPALHTLQVALRQGRQAISLSNTVYFTSAPRTPNPPSRLQTADPQTQNASQFARASERY